MRSKSVRAVGGFDLQDQSGAGHACQLWLASKAA